MIPVLADTNSGAYKLLLLAHLVVTIVGIGGVVLNGLYARESMRRPGPAGRGASEANFAVSEIAEKFIYLIPVFGILLVLVSDDAWGFGQTWIWVSMLLYVVAIGVSHGVAIPTHRQINALLLEMESAGGSAGGAPPQVAQVEVLGKRAAVAGTTLHVITVALIALMIWKPGV